MKTVENKGNKQYKKFRAERNDQKIKQIEDPLKKQVTTFQNC